MKSSKQNSVTVLGEDSIIIDDNGEVVTIPAPQSVKKKESEEPKVYVIFKRCGKASLIVKLPEKETKLKVAKFGKSLVEKSKIKAGDVINTAKHNQLLIVSIVNYNLSYILDIEPSTFELSGSYVIGRDALEYIDLIKIQAVIIDGEKTYIINKRPYSFEDLRDTARELDLPEDIVKLIKEERVKLPATNKKKEAYYAYVPNYIYSLLGSIKESFFSRLIG